MSMEQLFTSSRYFLLSQLVNGSYLVGDKSTPVNCELRLVFCYVQQSILQICLNN